MAVVDLSHTITHQMTTYPGLPGPRISAHLTFEASATVYAPGTEFTIGRIDMVANTGTYLDTPAHRYRDGHDLAGLPLARCADLPALVLDVRAATGPQGAVDATALTAALSDATDPAGPDVGPAVGSQVLTAAVRGAVAGAAVLVRTGWDAHWGSDRYGDPVHPHLTEEGADLLVQLGAALVGIDSVNVDDTTGGHRPAHSVLLAAGVPVVEHLTGLGQLPAVGARFSAVPPAVRGLATFPVRAHAVLP